MLVAADHPQEFKLELVQSLTGTHDKRHFMRALITGMKGLKVGAGEPFFHLGVAGHKAVHVVVDLLEYKAPVHEGEAALSEKVRERCITVQNYVNHQT